MNHSDNMNTSSMPHQSSDSEAISTVSSMRPKSKSVYIEAALACSNALIDWLFTDRLFKMSPEIAEIRKIKHQLYQGGKLNLLI